MSKEKRPLKKKLGITAAVLLYALIAGAVVWMVAIGGNYPSGSDTLCHIYKGDILYQNIKAGNWYPLYDNLWYNGVQMMRYWAPLPIYVLAFCQMLAGGEALSGYLVYVGLILFFGALSWLFIGVKKNRPVFGAFLGVLWFFMPNNLYALFGEGNLPRSLSMVLLPLLIYHIHQFLMEDCEKSIKWIVLIFTGILLCHVGYAGMIALALLIFLLFYKILNRQSKKCLTVIISLLLPFLLIGIWLYASLKGGITSTDSSQVMKGFFQDAWISLNPFYRYESNNVTFYFGLAAFVLAVFGGLCSHRKSMPGFFTAVVIFFCTTSSMYPVLEKLPGSQYLWMLRFISIALCMILYSFLLWDTLKKPFIWVCCLLLVADVIPSVSLFYSGMGTQTAEENLKELSDTTLITKAKEVTRQRLALLDGSSLGATAPYLVSDFGDQKVQGAFGAGWQSAATANRIVELNQAVEDGNYLYLFDRALEMGNDTVLIQISMMKNKSWDVDYATECAARLGYEKIEENDGYVLYHMAADGTFGIRTQYDAIGIGGSAKVLSFLYPDMEETDSANLDDYSFEELSAYKVVYLDHFTYTDKTAAEELVRKLSENGTKVVISADGIPTNERLKVQEFLGVSCSSILFENGYPILSVGGEELDCALFAQGYSNWQTVYLNGLTEVKGTFEDNGLSEAFYGTGENENIIFVGLNLSYHYMLTQDVLLENLFNDIFGMDRSTLPQREIEPVTVEYGRNQITITSEEDGVNTTLAYHDIFESEEHITAKQALLYVDSGTTIITMRYPYLAEGIAMSTAGAVLTILFLLWCKKRYGKEKLENGEQGESKTGDSGVNPIPES